MSSTEQHLREQFEQQGQGHVFQFWDQLDREGRKNLIADLEQVDFRLTNKLVQEWVLNEPPPEKFDTIQPVPVIPVVNAQDPKAQEAFEAGAAALRAGRVGLFLVAGGQGTRLGFNGPKGAYPVGPLSERTLFEFHAEKIHNLQEQFACVLPWYIMVSEANEQETTEFFDGHEYFGLGKENITFLTQRMVPCVDEHGKFMLERRDHLAMNPNGHGGSIPAMVEKGILADARKRGIDLLSYFQVDNWAVKVADPYFLGYHLLNNAEMSSKNHRKQQPREAVGVHCLCDGEYRVIEYSELGLYPQLLETDAMGRPLHYAGNPAIHILSVDFVSRVYDKFDEFPWHRAHKKVPYVNPKGEVVEPAKPNAYKFETFVFDALRFAKNPIALEIDPPGEYTPIKSFSGENSVEGAWETMRGHWATWLEAAGAAIPSDPYGAPTIAIEISPQFALTQEEFLQKTSRIQWRAQKSILILPNGRVLQDEEVPPQ